MSLAPTTTTTNQFGTTTMSSSGSGASSISQKWGRTWILGLTKANAPDTSTAAIDVGSDTQSRTQEGTYLNLNDFHFTFEVEMGLDQTVWSMVARVYNVPPDWLNDLLEYSEVQLIAGYLRPTSTPDVATKTDAEMAAMSPEEFIAYNKNHQARTDAQAAQVKSSGGSGGGAVLFDGEVIWIEHGRESPTDTYMEFHCNSLDMATNVSISNTTLPEGYTPVDVIGRCTTDMQEINGSKVQIKMGQMPDGLSDTKSPRGRTLYGPTQAILRDVAQSADGFIHVDLGGQVHLITPDNSLPNPLVTLNSTSGMVGIPYQGIDGSMRVVSLLNPDLQPGRLIKLNEKEIRRSTLTTAAATGQTSGSDPAQTQQMLQNQSMGIAGDGIYTVWHVRHYGDTRGNDWYSEVTTWSVDASKGAPQAGGNV